MKGEVCWYPHNHNNYKENCGGCDVCLNQSSKNPTSTVVTEESQAVIGWYGFVVLFVCEKEDNTGLA